jgi:GNAT superfamily N-acetyltransferase
MQTVIRPLSASDIPDAMALVIEAGWNQTSADWQRFLAATPDGCFKALADERLVGTVTTKAYDERLAWIGMVLVDRAHRARGIGRLLMETVLDYVDRAGIRCVMLDATPAGQGLYEKFGFVEQERLERWELTRHDVPRSAEAPERRICEQVMDLDRTLFGADRRGLLRSLEAEAPELAVEIVDAQQVHGYVFGRRGTLADHLGPWMAREERTANDLLDTFLERSARSRVFVDCFVHHDWGLRLMKARGFHLSRPLTRMCRGKRPVTAKTPALLAAVGPEFG